jgi:ATP-dependent Clp protease ATP-binding subunit ClpC
MIDRFTKRAKQVLTDASEEARRFNHWYIGTEHLLLGLIRSESITGEVLRELGVEVQRARSAAEFVVGHGEHPSGKVTELTVSARKVLDYALEEAHKLNHHYVGPEHLLLGLSRQGEGVASGVLEILGVRLEHVAPRVFAKMGLDQAAQRPAATPFLDSKQGSRSAMNLQPSPRRPITWLLLAALGSALVYITRLQRALQAAQQRGDTYRDLVAELDQQQDKS